MARLNRGSLLAHPVVEALLFHKQLQFGAMSFFVNLALYLVFLIFLTVFVIKTPPRLGEVADLDPLAVTSMLFVLGFSGFRVITEILQLAYEGTSYMRNFVNLFEWMVFSFAATFLLPFFVRARQTAPQWSFGAVTVFLAWINLLLFVRKIERVGIYVLMFEDILRTVIKVRSRHLVGLSCSNILMLLISRCCLHFFFWLLGLR